MKAHELLADPKKWTKGAYARDRQGRPINPLFSNAESFCMIGAVIRCYPDIYDQDKVNQKLFTRSELKEGVGRFNDRVGRTHAEVLAVLKALDI